jgi:hypothetical protein
VFLWVLLTIPFTSRKNTLTRGNFFYSSAWLWVRVVPHMCPALPRDLTPLFDGSRNAAISPARTPFLFQDRHILAMQLPILAQASLVPNRRRMVLPLRRAPAVMDHSHADRLGLGNALDVLQRPSVPGQCSSFSGFFVCVCVYVCSDVATYR